MKKVQRVGDANDAGGVISASLQDFVYCNGKLVAVDGSPVTPHKPFFPPHTGTVTANGSSFVFINGIPVNFETTADSCGHVRVDGSPDVFVEE